VSIGFDGCALQPAHTTRAGDRNHLLVLTDRSAGSQGVIGLWGSLNDGMVHPWAASVGLAYVSCIGACMEVRELHYFEHYFENLSSEI
jgi:hypothetical protein